jgi:hypothetical protein
MPNLDEILQRMASIEYYNNFLRGESSDGEAKVVTPVITEQTVFDRLKAEKERLLATEGAVAPSPQTAQPVVATEPTNVEEVTF